MTARAHVVAKTTDTATVVQSSTLQRACACGGTAGVSGKCAGCEQEERLGVQPKLTVNASGDRYEQEADRIADHVVSGAGPTAPGSLVISPLIQRQEIREDEEEELQTKPDRMQRQAMEEEDEETLQTKRGDAGVPRPGPAFGRALAAESNGGSPLNPSARGLFESRFGRDLSHVRVHDGARAAELSRQINARAFTHGRHIFFGAGQHDSRSVEGRRLFAHELTHTLQQGTLSTRLEGTDKVIQRFETCESQEDCPARERGEISRSRSALMELYEITSGGSGLLLADFAVGRSTIRGDLTTNPRWTAFVGAIASTPNISWRVIGFTDCTGDESLNIDLRIARATKLYLALPATARSRIGSYGGAPLGDCIRSNTSEANRRLNRSAVIWQESTSYEFDPLDLSVDTSDYVACFDGSTVFARKNGRSHSCSAVSGNVGDPTPDGVYCIRRQGEAQIAGGIVGRLFQDRDMWFLLEPQFDTQRYRMHLHPGTNSAGCVTATDSSCFDELAEILTGAGTITRQGYDGYPPGNAAGVENEQRSVTCVGLLYVSSSTDGCRFIRSEPE